MSDWLRHLPLGGRERGDESGVSGDWRPKIAATLSAFSASLATRPDSEWETPTLRRAAGGGVASVRDVLDALVRRLGSTRLELLFPEPRETREPDEILAALDAASTRAARHGGRGSLSELDAVLTSVYDVCHVLGLADPAESLASGAVALGRAAAAPTPLRAVLRDHTITATDAEWQIGRGPEIRGTAMLLVLWLAGRPLRPEFER